tara:strand:+ start:2461 stop:2688 length:228 start_codon:yes stop_codon:yes gene_type:complete
MAIPTDLGTMNINRVSGLDPAEVAERIKRLTEFQLTQLASILAEDYMADKLLPKLEYALMERNSPLTRIDMPRED